MAEPEIFEDGNQVARLSQLQGRGQKNFEKFTHFSREKVTFYENVEKLLKGFHFFWDCFAVLPKSNRKFKRTLEVGGGAPEFLKDFQK